MPLEPRRVLHLEDFRRFQQFFKDLNQADLSQLEVYDQGEKVHIPTACLDEWKFIGLSNYTFFDMEFYNEPEFKETSSHGLSSEGDHEGTTR